MRCDDPLQLEEDVKEPMTLFEMSRGRRPRCNGLSDLCRHRLGGRGVINTWTDVAARVRLHMLTSDLTSLVPPQFSNWLQVRKVGSAYFLNFLFTIGAAQVRSVTEIRTKITDRMCEQKPCTK